MDPKDLKRNLLDDNIDNLPSDSKAVKVALKVLNAHDKYRTIITVLTYLKLGSAMIVLSLFIWAGILLFNLVSDVSLSVNVVNENEAVVRSAVRETAKDKPANDLIAGFGNLVNDIKTSVDAGFDAALQTNGLHPDAPNSCAFAEKGDELCIDYTSTELSARDYTFINDMWDTACPVSHQAAMNLLKTNGMITYNDKRLLGDQCHSVIEEKQEQARDELKQQLLGTP